MAELSEPSCANAQLWGVFTGRRHDVWKIFSESPIHITTLDQSYWCPALPELDTILSDFKLLFAWALSNTSASAVALRFTSQARTRSSISTLTLLGPALLSSRRLSSRRLPSRRHGPTTSSSLHATYLG